MLALLKKNPSAFFFFNKPVGYLGMKALDSISSFLGVGDPPTIKQQRDAAIEIIKAGRENNADEISITLDQEAGIDLGSRIEGIPLKCSIGKSGKMTITVKYK